MGGGGVGRGGEVGAGCRGTVVCGAAEQRGCRRDGVKTGGGQSGVGLGLCTGVELGGIVGSENSREMPLSSGRLTRRVRSHRTLLCADVMFAS